MANLSGKPRDQCKLFSFLQQLSKKDGSDKDFIYVTKKCGTAVYREKI